MNWGGTGNEYCFFCSRPSLPRLHDDWLDNSNNGCTCFEHFPRTERNISPFVAWESQNPTQLLAARWAAKARKHGRRFRISNIAKPMEWTWLPEAIPCHRNITNISRWKRSGTLTIIRIVADMERFSTWSFRPLESFWWRLVKGIAYFCLIRSAKGWLKLYELLMVTASTVCGSWIVEPLSHAQTIPP